MTMNREFDRTASFNSGNKTGLEFIEALRIQFNIARDNNIVKEPSLIPEKTALHFRDLSPDEILMRLRTVPMGKAIRQWRNFRRISGVELADRTESSKGYISQIEHSKIKNPRWEKLEKIAIGLGLTLFDLHIRRLPGDIVPNSDIYTSS